MMLSLTQRLILGCAALAGLTLWLALATRGAIAAAGHRTLAIALPAAAIVLAILTIVAVLAPLRTLASDAHKIAQGNLDHRSAWAGRDSAGVLAAEINRLAVRLRELRESDAGRRQMEFQLSDAVLQSIFEPIIVTDAKGHLLKVNQSAAELLGPSSTDRMALTNTPGGDKILSAIRDAVAMQKPIAAEGDSAVLPMRIGQHDRSYRLRATPMRDTEGRLLGAVTTLEDVTAVQNTDRFKTQFIAVASRKLRDPLLQLRRGLYAIGQGFAGDLSPLQTDLVTEASREAQILDDLMADLIEVAEIDTGKREMKLENLRPIALLQEVDDRYADQAAQKKVHIEIQAYADLSFIRADRRAVRSIFDNLLANAIRFTPPEGEILLAAEELKNFVQFTVRDAGRGIEADRLATIFDRFNASSESGTGMGLALVRRLVESLGGQIAVESRLGQGTTFRFTLPVATVEAVRHPVEVG
ncbi:ATP-binding protein [Terracidiphilus sp.]|jgi:signal transduction histidine kinase|uniref:sensor histidine kinase n=1 Tax=Terracidiphilus sp. TaxID=1964191 RepID=UPI003C22C1DF